MSKLWKRQAGAWVLLSQTPVTPPADPGAILYGVNTAPGDTTASGPYTSQTTRLADFGRVPCSRVYYSGQCPTALNGTITGASPEKRCQFSFKGWQPAQIVAGLADSALTSLAADAQAKGYRLFATYWHEPNKELNTGQYTATDYKNAHIHIAKLLWSLPSKNVVTPMLNYSAPNASGGNAWDDSWLPTFAQLGNPNAVMSWDSYGNPSGGTGLDGAYPEPSKVFTQMYQKTQQFGYEANGRWGVTEFNTPRRNFDSNEAQRGPWIQAAVDYLKALPTTPHHVFLWEGDGVQFDQNFYTSNTRSVWRAITADSA